MSGRRGVVVLALLALAGPGCADRPAATAEPPLAPQTVRVAVIGGMTGETGLWPALALRFTAETGHGIELAATGPKGTVIGAFRAGGIDLIVVHACDAMINLVADGLAVDPQPWARNDLILVGPPGDPAGVRGTKDVVVALRAILAGKHKLIVHASMGADGVLHDLLEAGGLALDPDATVFMADERHAILARAAAENGYTLVGRIPFVSKKLPRSGLEIMVQGDPRLRRPYLVEVAAGSPTDPRLRAAHRLAAWLRQPSTQAWLAEFGRGRWDPEPIFFPVVAE